MLAVNVSLQPSAEGLCGLQALNLPGEGKLCLCLLGVIPAQTVWLQT